MGSKEILDQALKLKPEERFLIIEGLIVSLDQPDKNLDEIWAQEAEKGLRHTEKVNWNVFPWKISSVKRMKVIFTNLAKLELEDATAFYELEYLGLGKDSSRK